MSHGEVELMLRLDLELDLLCAGDALAARDHLRHDLLRRLLGRLSFLLLGLPLAQLLGKLPRLADEPMDELRGDPVAPRDIGLFDVLDHVAMDDVNNLGRRQFFAMAFLVVVASWFCLSCSRIYLLL